MSKEKITIPPKIDSINGADHHVDTVETHDSTETHEMHQVGASEDAHAHAPGGTHGDEIMGGDSDRTPSEQSGEGNAEDSATRMDATGRDEGGSGDDGQHSGAHSSDGGEARVEARHSHHSGNDEDSGGDEHMSDGHQGHDEDDGYDDDHDDDNPEDHDDDDDDDHVVCFAAGTLIETPTGPVSVEDLGVGKKVLCGDGIAREILWFSGREVTAEEMREHPEFRPIRIRKGAFGDNLPNQDLLVSPQHRILIDDWRASLMFGMEKVLVPAVYLLNDHDIVRDHEADGVVYYHFMFDRHHTVISNGIQSESFFPGATALAGIDEAAKQELLRLFPHLSEGSESFGPTCCRTLKAYEAMALLGA